MSKANGLDGTHLRRFSVEEARFLSAYGVFHGDDRFASGEPLPTGSLKKTGPSSTTSSYFQSLPGPPQSQYLIQPTMSLRSLTQRQQPATSKTIASNRSVGLNSTTYNYSSGVSFQSTSGKSQGSHRACGHPFPSIPVLHKCSFLSEGLPPTPYKSWSTEYVDEYRGPKVRKDLLASLTQTHGTRDALRSTRYQFQGYPHAFKSYAPTSLTAKGQVRFLMESETSPFKHPGSFALPGAYLTRFNFYLQVMPDYESRVKAF